MDHGRCTVVYLDRRARKTNTYQKEDNGALGPQRSLLDQEEDQVCDNIRALLSNFDSGESI